MFDHLFDEAEAAEEVEEVIALEEEATEDDIPSGSEKKRKGSRKRMSGAMASLPVVKEDKYPEDPEFLVHRAAYGPYLRKTCPEERSQMILWK